MRAPLLVAALSLAALSLTACGGAGRAKGSLASAVESLELARKTGCPHESLPLAEKTYEEAKRLLDEGKYNESEAKSRVARHLAQEAARANGGQPCAAAPTAVSPVTDVTRTSMGKSVASHRRLTDSPGHTHWLLVV